MCYPDNFGLLESIADVVFDAHGDVAVVYISIVGPVALLLVEILIEPKKKQLP